MSTYYTDKGITVHITDSQDYYQESENPKHDVLAKSLVVGFIVFLIIIW